MPDAETSERREILADPALSPIPHPAITNLDLNAMLHEASLRAAALLDQQDAPDARIELARMMACEGSRFDAQEVATRAGIHRAELSRIRRAYQLGGEIGVDVYLRTFDPGPDLRERLEQARVLERLTAVITDNCLTWESIGVQIRLGPDGSWYPFTRTAEGWSPAAGISRYAEDAYRAAKRARSHRTGRRP
ncbi:hypothetical protein [Kribbella aluminosa]|uniref:hypothetical protein n=1 Tax=Kribbella aluminosa TaxID=416017 RepID=UPI0031D61FEA